MKNYHSKGKSDYIEYSLVLLDSAIREGNIEEIQAEMNNHTIPAELRSISWRIFLKILPIKDSLHTWISTTDQNRDIYFEKISQFKYSEILRKLCHDPNFLEILKETNHEFLHSDEYKHYSDSIEFIRDISEIYDLFKLHFVIEVTTLVYILYRSSHSKFQVYTASFLNILASIVYSLYPSISHSNADYAELKGELHESKSVQIKKLYYFLTHEDYFEHDVYTIFENIMESHSHRETIMSLNKEVINTLIDINEDSPVSTIDCTMMELVMLMVKSSKPKIIEHFKTYSLDVNMVFKYWVSSFFSSSFLYEDVTYLIDILLCNQECIPTEHINLSFINQRIKFHFLLCTIASIICCCEGYILRTQDLKELNDYLLIMDKKISDLKLVLKRALNIREAMTLLYDSN